MCTVGSGTGLGSSIPRQAVNGAPLGDFDPLLAHTLAVEGIGTKRGKQKAQQTSC